MKRRNQFRAAEVVHAAAQPRDGIERAQQCLCRELAERDDHLRLHDLDLPEEKRLALLHFVRLRIPVARRPALDDVRDVDILASEADRFDDLGEQLTGTADERLTLNVFVAARRLAGEHQVGLWMSDAEHDLPPAERMQLAPCAIADVAPYRDERLGGPPEQGDRIRPGLETIPDPLWIAAIRHRGRLVLFEILRVGGKTLPDPLWTRVPGRVQADPGDAELGGEAQMFLQLIAIHRPTATRRRPCARQSASRRDRGSGRPPATSAAAAASPRRPRRRS